MAQILRSGPRGSCEGRISLLQCTLKDDPFVPGSSAKTHNGDNTMRRLKTTLTLLTASLGTALLALPAAATPIAVLNSTGLINGTFQTGISVMGDVDAQYRTPPGSPRPYEFKSSLDLGSVSVTPVVNVTTPEIVLIPETEICVPFFGCVTIPGISLPSVILPLAPSIALTDPVNVYNVTYTSGVLPLGGIFNFDFGTPLLGQALTLDNVVQEQFETGATTVSTSGSLGPFDGTFEYEGVLQPGNEQILGLFMADLTGPGLLAELENALLGILNNNVDLIVDIVFDAIIATDPCAAAGDLADLCRAALEGLDPSSIGIEVVSLGNFSANYDWRNSIEPVPVPATLPLLALGLVLIGVTARRRRMAAAVQAAA